MAYLVIQDFKIGMDRRKARITGQAGALWVGVNGHITRGGDFERRKKFVPTFNLPAGTTKGMSTVNGQLFVFGASATPGTIPGGVIYQRLAHPGIRATATFTVTAGTASPGVNKLTALTINGVNVLGSAVDWVTSNAATAAAIAAAINATVSVPDYTATVNGAVITVLAAAGSGATPNGFVILPTFGGNFTMSYSTVMSGGSDGSANTITSILSTTSFSGKLYVVALFSDGNTYHYYNGNRVTSWDDIAASVSSNEAVAAALALRIDAANAYVATSGGSVITISAATPGVPFSISASTINGGSINDQTITLLQTQPNITAVTETRATATLTVTGGTASAGVNKLSALTINGVEALGAAVDWTTSNSATATAIANQINSYSSAPEYTASANGAVVTIQAAAGTGAGPNGFVLNPTVGGNVTVSVTNMAGGITAATAQAQIYSATIGGTFETADTFTIILDGTAYIVSGGAAGTGIMALTYQQKVYSITNSLLYFSALNTPTQFGSGIGNGFINMSNQNEGNEPLVTIQEYQGKLAIFSRNNIRIWTMDVDPAKNAFQQTVQNSGALSNRSVIPYGNIDVFYLNDSGVRSLRARDASNSPAVNDVGVAIDPFLREYLNTLNDTQIQRATALIEPIDSRYWLAVHNRIFVFSYFPGSKINAWSYYDLTDEIGGSDISEMVKVNNQVYLRADDKIYLYGGSAGTTYPNDGEIQAEASMPFLAAGTPATFKGIRGFDIGVEGTWKCSVLVDPAREDVELPIGTFNKPTFAQPRMIVKMPSPLFALRMITTKGGYARISMAAVHYKAQVAG